MADFVLDNPDAIIQEFSMVVGDTDLENDNTQLLIKYSARSYPPKIAELQVYQYSLDNDSWVSMSYPAGTLFTDLDLSTNWTNFYFTWLITDDIPDIYDKNIWIKLKIISDDLYYESVKKVYFRSVIDITNAALVDLAPPSYNGMGTLDVLKEAP